MRSLSVNHVVLIQIKPENFANMKVINSNKWVSLRNKFICIFFFNIKLFLKTVLIP